VQQIADKLDELISALPWGERDPPTQSEVQAIVGKLDELINALRR
jgi:hypothetical protein